MLEYMLANSTDVITRMYTMVSDLSDLELQYKAALRNGILKKYPDFKFQEAEIKQEAPKGLLVTAKMLEVKRSLAEDIEKVQLPKVAAEIGEAKEKGDLKENAEYIAAKEVSLIPELLGEKNITNIKKYLSKTEIKKSHITFIK